MGRFYKTAKPNMIDFMYQVPEQAILGAIKGADAQLERQEQFLTDFQKQLKHQALSPDKEEQKQMLKQYEDQIKQHALNISSSPLEALKQKQGIRELGNTIYEDITRGKLAAQYSNYAARQDFEKRYREEAMKKDGRVTTKQVEDALAAWDAQYAGKGGLNYDPTTGNYRKYGTEELATYMDAFNLGEEAAKGWKEDALKTSSAFISPDGKWKIKEGNSIREANFNDIFQGTTKELNSNQKLKDYLNEQLKFNKLAGDDPRVGLTLEDIYGKRKINEDGTSEYEYRTYVDENGKTQYETDKYGQKIPVKGGILWDAAYKAAEKYGFKETDKGRTDITETKQYEADIDFDKTKKVKALDAEIRPDNNNAEVTVTLLDGQSIDEVRTNIANQSKLLAGQLDNNLNSYLKSLETSGLSPALQKQIGFQIRTKLDAVKAAGNDPDKANQLLDDLQNYMTKVNEDNNNVIGLQNIATGVTQLKDNYLAGLNKVNNDNQRLGAIWNAVAKEKGLDVELKNISADYSLAQKKLKQLELEVTMGRATKEDYNTQEEKVRRLKQRYTTTRQQVDVATDYALKTDHKDSKNLNTIQVYTTAGQYLSNVPGVEEEDVREYNKALTSLEKTPLFSNVLSGSNSKMIINGTGSPISYDKGIELGIFDNIKDDGENVTFTKDGLVVGSFKKQMGSLRNVVTEDNGLGMNRGDYQVTLIATGANKLLNNQTAKTMEWYIDKKEIPLNAVNKVFAKADAALTAQSIKDEADKANVDKSNLDYHYTRTVKGKTYTHYPNQGTNGKWLIPTDQGMETMYGEDGQRFVANQLKK